MPIQIDFLPVGDSNGDAICMRYGAHGSRYIIHIVDGGYKDTGDVVVEHVTRFYDNPRYVDHVLLSHADQDHLGGLSTVLQAFEVGTLWMNRPWLYAEEILHRFQGNYTVQGLANEIKSKYPGLVELEEIAIRRGIEVREAFAGARVGQFMILAPTRSRYLSLIPDFDRTPKSRAEADAGFFGRIMEVVKEVQAWVESWADEKLSNSPPATSASNESSLVQLGVVDGNTFVLTADAGPEALTEAADVAEHFGVLKLPKLFQIPHHGSRRNLTPTVLNRWLGVPVAQGTPLIGAAYCSVGENKPEYPRKRVKNAILRRGYGVYRTGDKWIYYQIDFPRAGTVSLDSEAFETSYRE